MEELVVLVTDRNEVIGTTPKASVHTKDTPLHRGFSLFVFNAKKQVLITQRALSKKTFPGVWTNTVCGHPALDESSEYAAARRLLEELGMVAQTIQEIAPYRYRFADTNGIVENEICPVLVGQCDSDPQPKPDEVEAWQWLDWSTFLTDIQENPDKYSPWCREEAQLVAERFSF